MKRSSGRQLGWLPRWSAWTRRSSVRRHCGEAHLAEAHILYACCMHTRFFEDHGLVAQLIHYGTIFHTCARKDSAVFG